MRQRSIPTTTAVLVAVATALAFAGCGTRTAATQPVVSSTLAVGATSSTTATSANATGTTSAPTTTEPYSGEALPDCGDPGKDYYPPRAMPPLPSLLLSAADLGADYRGGPPPVHPMTTGSGAPIDYQAASRGSINAADAAFSGPRDAVQEIVGEFESPAMAGAQLLWDRRHLYDCVDTWPGPPHPAIAYPRGGVDAEFWCGTSRGGGAWGVTARTVVGRYLLEINVSVPLAMGIRCPSPTLAPGIDALLQKAEARLGKT
jgi:hypothetical protein